jgi:hypothetical protein
MLMEAKWRARDIFAGVVRELHTVAKIKVVIYVCVCICMYAYDYKMIHIYIYVYIYSNNYRNFLITG